MCPSPPYLYMVGWCDGWLETAADWSGGVVPDGTVNATIAGTGSDDNGLYQPGGRCPRLNDANATFAVINGDLVGLGGLDVVAAQEIEVLNGTLSFGGGSQTMMAPSWMRARVPANSYGSLSSAYGC